MSEARVAFLAPIATKLNEATAAVAHAITTRSIGQFEPRLRTSEGMLRLLPVAK